MMKLEEEDAKEPASADATFADYAGISQRIYADGDRFWGKYRGFRLTSVFQPIFSFAHPRPVGYEALVRIRNPLGQPVSPASLFAASKGDEQGLILLDRTCRAIHVRNFLAADPAACWLFLNVNPQVILEGPWYSTFFDTLIKSCGIAPHRIVIEVVETEIADEAALAEGVGFYRDLGCLVAIDDFGTGFSNINRIWKIRPDIVKLDRELVAQAPRNPALRQWLPRLVSLLHEVGCLVVAEGVETESEALAVMEADVDLFQGYFFGMPVEGIGSAAIRAPLGLYGMLREKWSSRGPGDEAGHLVRPLMGLFAEAQAKMAAGEPLDVACARLLERRGIQRCFMLDGEGAQAGPNLMGRPAEEGGDEDRRFEPLRDPTGASWFQRPYFRRAVANPGEIQVSRPYLSLTGARMCMTLSVSIKMADRRTRVLCCDFDWPPPSD